MLSRRTFNFNIKLYDVFEDKVYKTNLQKKVYSFPNFEFVFLEYSVKKLFFRNYMKDNDIKYFSFHYLHLIHFGFHRNGYRSNRLFIGIRMETCWSRSDRETRNCFRTTKKVGWHSNYQKAMLCFAILKDEFTNCNYFEIGIPNSYPIENLLDRDENTCPFNAAYQSLRRISLFEEKSQKTEKLARSMANWL